MHSLLFSYHSLQLLLENAIAQMLPEDVDSRRMALLEFETSASGGLSFVKLEKAVISDRRSLKLKSDKF